ncbi:MAG TPA: hypothetical protein VEI54_02980 [Candidatus Limnocylindrales bacterium]|nr:hypothetical protein [Candidatus Limnocylindrales bacterium]
MPQSKILNPQVIVLFGISLLLGGCKQAVSPPKIETVPTVSVDELLANPQSHAHTMVKASGCFVLGLESVTLLSCGAGGQGKAIWVEDARFVREMQKHRLPDVPDAIPKGLEKPSIQKELFTYDEKRNTEAWKKLTPSPDREQTVLEVVLLGQFETAAVPLLAQSAFGHLGAYSHELILADVLSAKPAEFPSETEQTESSHVVNTSVCEIVGDVLRFVGKRVRFSAKFQSDGFEYSVLTDPECGRGIEPFVPDEIDQHPDIQAFDHALDAGIRGTIDKHIVATFTGRFVLRNSDSSRLRFVLNIERVDHLKVTLVDMKPHIPQSGSGS